MSVSFCINVSVSTAVAFKTSAVNGIPIILIQKIQTVYIHKNRQFFFTVTHESFAPMQTKTRKIAYTAAGNGDAPYKTKEEIHNTQNFISAGRR